MDQPSTRARALHLIIKDASTYRITQWALTLNAEELAIASKVFESQELRMRSRWRSAAEAHKQAHDRAPYGWLRGHRGQKLRPATEDDRDASAIAAEVQGDGKPGLIVLDGQVCYVD